MMLVVTLTAEMQSQVLALRAATFSEGLKSSLEPSGRSLKTEQCSSA